VDIHDFKYLVKHLWELTTAKNSNHLIEEDWYYFMHIPKTAGTSIRYALFDQFSGNEIYPNNVDYYLKRRGSYIKYKDFIQKPKAYVTPKIKVLTGHLRLFPIEHCRAKKPKTFTFFRDPVKRIVSSVNYHSINGRRLEKLSLTEKINRIKSKNEGKRMATFFGYDSNENNIEEVLRQIENVDAIGLMEHFDQSLQNINQTFSWDLKSDIHKNKKKAKTTLDPLLLQAIQEACHIDSIVYNHAKKIFLNQCKANGIVI